MQLDGKVALASGGASGLGRATAALVVPVVQTEMLNGEVIRLDGALRMARR